MAKSIRCGSCRHILLQSAEEDVFFYVKDENQVHITVKPERLLSVKKLPNDKVKFVTTQTGGDDHCWQQRKKKRAEIKCGKCDVLVGGIWPFGPDNCDMATFGRNCIEMCGVPPTKKSKSKRAPKFAELYRTIPEWQRLERRIGEDNFRLAIRQSESAPTSRLSAPSVDPLIPDVPLVLPEFSSTWMGEVDTLQLEEIDSLFGWTHDQLQLSPRRKFPRLYQIQAIVEGLLRDLIVVLPTGAGKTLVAAHILLRLKILNPDYMALFVVDRVPLVFQQGQALKQETGLRVCWLCGENSSTMTLQDLNEGRFDVLVITAGCLLNLLSKRWLDLAKQFCCIVFDECHHASRNHVYCKVMDHLKSGFHTTLPRVIGLTASPMPSHTINTANRRLNELCECFGPNTGVLYPEVPPTSTRVRWHVVKRNQSQDSFARRVIQHLKRFIDEMNELLVMHGAARTDHGRIGEGQSLILLEKCDDSDLDHFLNPDTVGRLRGHLRSACWKMATTASKSEDHHEQIRRQVNFLSSTIKTLLAALEASEVMGPSFGENVAAELRMWMNDQADRNVCCTSDASKKFRNDQNKSSLNPPVTSSRLSHLMIELSTRLDTLDSRILILVHTREVARQLTSFLQSNDAIERAFQPRALVGHGGHDGMSWFHDQSVALDAFQRGIDLADLSLTGCRLLVATSVLEEGLDVAHCDLVVRLQGVQSLIGFIQSRGRARKQNSQMLVLTSEKENHHLKKVRQQEGAMKLVIQQHAKLRGLPSIAAQRIQDILSTKHPRQVIDTNTDNCLSSNPPTTDPSSWLRTSAVTSSVAQGNRQELVIRLIIPSADSIDDEDLEYHLSSVFARYGDTALTLSRVIRLSSVGVTNQIFEEGACQYYLVGFSLMPNEPASGFRAWSLFEKACIGWNFQLSSSKPAWIQRYDGYTGGNKNNNEQTFALRDCSLGVWGGPNMFVSRHVIPSSEIQSVSFKRKEGIVIDCTRDVSILISQAIISHFCLICCDGHQVNLFVPLSSAASVVQKRIIFDKQETIRLTDFDRAIFPHLRAVSMSTVLCLSIPLDSGLTLSNLLRMEKDLLAVPIFETRVSVRDESELVRLVDWEAVRRSSNDPLIINGDLPGNSSLPLMHNEYAFVVALSSPVQVIDPHLSELPTFNTTQSEVRDVHWLLLSALSQRLGCFTDGVRKYLWDFTIQIVDHLLAALNPDLLGLSDEISWLLYALQQCFGVPYWADVKEKFDSAYQSMARLDKEQWFPGECTAMAEEAIGRPKKVGNGSRRDDNNWFKVYRALQTPTRIVYQPPETAKGSRLYRRFGSQRFVTVSFRDEQMQQLHGKEIISSVRDHIWHGLTFAGREMVFFGASSSQLRSQQLLFVEIESMPTCSQEGEMLSTTSKRLHYFREQILDPAWITSILSDKWGGAPKFLSRLALFCTADTPTEIIEDTHTAVVRVDDITVDDAKLDAFGTSVTDGIGCVAFSLAERVARLYLKLEFVPTALQVRYLGAKGMLLVLPDTHSRLRGRQISLRPSMEKFRMGAIQDNHLCVVDYSRYHPMFMNREIVTLLTSSGSGNGEIYHTDGRRYAPLEALQENLAKTLSEEATIFQDADKAADCITMGGTTVDGVAQAILELLPHVDVLRDPFCVDILRSNYRFKIRSLVDKTRIPLQKGCQLMGVADEFGVLKDGEVFVQIDQHSDGHKHLLTQDDVAIWRNPCLHPGDVRICAAVDVQELRDFVNVIVFPAAKPGISRNLPMECSGGDLDGDMYYIIWDRELVPPRHTEVAPLPYNKLSQSQTENDADSAGEVTDGYIPRDTVLGITSSDDTRSVAHFSNEKLSAFISKVFAGDLLGRIANLHLALSDLLPSGARDPLACKVAEAQSFAVDFPKTGEPPKVPLKAVRMLKSAGHPDFMDKRDSVNYTSTKPLGFLYRRASSFDFSFSCVAQYASTNPNSKQAEGHHAALDLRIAAFARNATQAQRLEAERFYENYWTTLRGIMISYGLKSDTECILARTTRWHTMIHDTGKAEEVIRHKVSALFRELKNLFRQRYGNLGKREKWVIACLWYEVAYCDGRARSFSMVLANLVGEYLETCPIRRSSDPSIDACYDRVGKPLLKYCEMAQRQISESQTTKLAICQTLQRALEQSGLCPTAFQIRPFGSVAHGLSELYSDLDVYVDFGLHTPDTAKQFCSSANSFLLQGLGFLSKDDFLRSLSKAEREQQLLSMIVSPALEPICRRKEDILSARVPIVRCFIPLIQGDACISAEASAMQQVDVSACPIGVWKAHWMQEIFHQDPSLYCVVLLLLRWGRSVDLICKKDQISSAGYANHTALFVPGDFHALIFFALKNEIKLDVSLDNCTSFDPNKDTTRSPVTALACASRIGRLVFAFFQKVQDLADDLTNSGKDCVEFVWPLEKFWDPSMAFEQLEPDTQLLLTTRLETSRLLGMYPLLEPARHCLLSCDDSQQLFELSDARVVHFSQKLPLALSYRIGHALKFHECRLSQLSGCPKIELRPISATHNSQLLISAEATNHCIRRLKNELANSSKVASAGSWNCRTIARASRYFLENSTEIRVFGSSRADVQIKFRQIHAQRSRVNEADAIAAFLSRHSLDEHSLCRMVTNSAATCGGPQFYETKPNLFSIPLDLEELMLVRSLSVQMMRQLELPQTQSTTFESANLSVVFGHFVVVNVSRSLPDSQKTLSLGEFKLAMEKAGRQRKHWDRGDPTFHSEKRNKLEQSSTGSNVGLPTGNLGAAPNRRKKRNCSRKDAARKPGIATTFLPTFPGDADELFGKFSQSLTSAGFRLVDYDSFHSHKQSSGHISGAVKSENLSNTPVRNTIDYAMSIVVSKGYEVRADFLDNHVEISKATKISERSLNWMSHTLLGNGGLPDVRFRFRTTVPISERLSELALGNPHGLSPIRWTHNNIPSFNATTTPEVRKRILYVRHHMAERYFLKQIEHDGFSLSVGAKVTRLREFHQHHVDGFHFSSPVHKAEMYLDFDMEIANRIIQHGANSEMEKLACIILRESIAIALQLKKQGVQLIK